MAKALFLDRDGTLNHDTGYLNNPDDFWLFKGVPEALLRAQKAGYLLVIVSNQSGVGRGLITPEQIVKIHAKLDQLLSQNGVHIAEYSLCFHHPDENCECRKPNPKLIVDAARNLGVDLSESYMIGDRFSDIGCGLNAKVKHVYMVKSGGKMQEFEKFYPKTPDGVTVVEDLSAAVDLILSR